MKRFLFAAALALSVFAPMARAQASQPVPAAPADFTVYYDQWTPQQWRALQRQLMASLRAPIDQIDQSVLQNVIYFETHYPDAMQLERAASRLLRIYERHEQPEMRVLAITALHAAGEAESMKRLARVIRHEESDVARHVGIAAVVDFYRSQQ
jgi:hypothetical protein